MGLRLNCSIILYHNILRRVAFHAFALFVANEAFYHLEFGQRISFLMEVFRNADVAKYFFASGAGERLFDSNYFFADMARAHFKY